MSKEYNIPRTKVEISAEAKESVNKVLDSGNYIKGPENEQLGKEFADYCGAKSAIPVSSGSIGLFVALKLLGIQPGDEVITVPNTFIATANAIILVGAKPVFVDIDKNTFNMNIEELEKAINDKTKAIIPVHLYGLPVEMDRVMEIAKAKNIPVIEDACQSHGAIWKNKKTGSWADFAVFSFYPTKVLNTAGDGGIVLTNNENHIDYMNRIINHGRKSQYEYSDFGFNFRLSEIQAAVVRTNLKHLEEEIEARNRIAERYNKNLSSIAEIEIPFVPEGARHSYYLYTVKAKDRDNLREYLNAKGIGSSIEYPVILNKLDFIKQYMKNPEQNFPNAEYCLEHALSLPMYSSMTDGEIDTVTSEIAKFYATKANK